MADRKRIEPKATPTPKSDKGPPESAVEREPRHRPARPDPRTGEVPAGPGDAGLQSCPEINAGSPGTRQMSNRRLGIGLGIAALLAVIVIVFMAIF